MKFSEIETKNSDFLRDSFDGCIDRSVSYKSQQVVILVQFVRWRQRWRWQMTTTTIRFINSSRCRFRHLVVSSLARRWVPIIQKEYGQIQFYIQIYFILKSGNVFILWNERTNAENEHVKRSNKNKAMRCLQMTTIKITFLYRHIWL